MGEPEPRFDPDVGPEVDPAVAPDIDGIVELLRERVVARRLAGDYPAGMEEELEAGFAEVMAQVRDRGRGSGPLAARVAELRSVEVAPPTVLASRLPGGAGLHGAIGRSTARQTTPLADGLRAVQRATAAALDEVRGLFDAQRGADERVLNDVLGGMSDRLAIVDGLAAAVADLERRVAVLETSPSTVER